MNSSALPYLLSGIVLLAAVYAGYAILRNEEPTVLVDGYGSTAVEDSPPAFDGPPLAEFSLTERSGRTFHSSEMEGEVWVASFFFTTCPGSCLRLNQALQTVHDDPQLKDVKLVSITCDPDVDTPEVLDEYAQRFKADSERWLFCTGELDYIQRIGRDWMKLAVQRQTHSDRAAVIDRQGKLRGYYLTTNPMQVAMMKKVLADCLKEERFEAQQAAEIEPPSPEPAAP